MVHPVSLDRWMYGWMDGWDGWGSFLSRFDKQGNKTVNRPTLLLLECRRQAESESESVPEPEPEPEPGPGPGPERGPEPGPEPDILTQGVAIQSISILYICRGEGNPCMHTCMGFSPCL